MVGEGRDSGPGQLSDCCKLGRVATTYGVEEYLAGTLADEWAHPDGDSLRALARRFNRELLRKRYTETAEIPLDVEVDTIYDVLYGSDDVNETRRRRVEKRLDRRGIDADALVSDFVSYRTVDRHFKQCTDREKRDPVPVSRDEATENALDRIRALQNRLAAVAEKSLTDLSNAGHVAAGEFEVSVSVDVTCGECSEQLSMRRLLTEGCPTCGHVDEASIVEGMEPRETTGDSEIA